MLEAYTIQDLHWESADPVPESVEKRMAKLVVVRGEWGRLSAARQEEVTTLIQEEQLSMDMEQVQSLRYQLLMEKQSRRHRSLQIKRRTILQKYQAGETILALSKNFDFSPLSIFRAILTGIWQTSHAI
jgi:hypothetical protein